MVYRDTISATNTYYPGPLSDGLTNNNDTLDPRATDDFVINPHVLIHTVWALQNERQRWFNPLQNGFGTKWGFPDAVEPLRMPRRLFPLRPTSPWPRAEMAKTACGGA